MCERSERGVSVKGGGSWKEWVRGEEKKGTNMRRTNERGKEEKKRKRRVETWDVFALMVLLAHTISLPPIIKKRPAPVANQVLALASFLFLKERSKIREGVGEGVYVWICMDVDKDMDCAPKKKARRQTLHRRC